MQTTTDLDRFAVIKQAQHDRAAAEDARHAAEAAAEREADKLLTPDLDGLLRLIGVLTDADAPLADNTYTADVFTFSLVKSDRSNYVFLEIEHALTEDEGNALEHLLYRDNERLSLIINTDRLIGYTPLDGEAERFRANVGDRLNQLRFDYDRLRAAMAKEAAKVERTTAVVLEYRYDTNGEKDAFERRASELVQAGYKAVGYTAGMSEAPQGWHYMVVTALFVLSDAS